MDSSSVTEGLPVNEKYSLPSSGPWKISSYAEYKTMYDRSIAHPDAFWGENARETLDWIRPFTRVSEGSFQDGDFRWFAGGLLNASVNCVDRHARTHPDQTAIIWEGDEPTETRRISYKELLTEVCKTANLLMSLGVRKRDRVTIYMPMVPEAAISMLACARIGAVHSVVFGGFSSANLKDRILDAESALVITMDHGMRGGKKIPLKDVVDEALKDEKCKKLVKNVLVFSHDRKENSVEEEAELCISPISKRTKTDSPAIPSGKAYEAFLYREIDSNAPPRGPPGVTVLGRDVAASSAIAAQRPYCPPEPMDAEDLLFMLYTSGSTGKPKGIAHTTAGYLLYTALTHRLAFDYRPGDVFGCMADVGWITGHSYVVYGPLLNGATTFMFESLPTYPDAGRYWDMVQRHKITHFYTAPTALRTLMKFPVAMVTRYDRSSLRVLGSVGEPINPEAWRWYFETVGNRKCPIIDTYWQTETGGFVITPLPCFELKPGSASLPFFGVEPAIMDSATGKELVGANVKGSLVIKKPWPGIMRTVFGDHQRMHSTYFAAFPGFYFTGDGCIRDEDGYYWITGRVDDVIKVSGHRIGSAEVEHALVQNPGVAEAAVIGFPHEIKGEALCCFVTPKNGQESSAGFIAELKATVRKMIGPVATPDLVILTPALPKTRSGKIMRRILRKIVHGEADQLGDVSTLADASVIPDLIARTKAALG